MAKHNRKPRLCFVSSSGGHWEQLQKLEPLAEKYEGFFVTEKTQFEAPLGKYFMLQTDLKDKLMPFKMLWNSLYTVGIWIRERPDFVITTGTMVAYPFYLLAVLFHKKIVYIETFGRANMPTVAGKMMEKHADLFIVQWESQKKYYKKAIWGGVFVLIFVTVGSRNYPFDRLFQKLDALYEDGTLTEEMFAQVGTSTYQPKHYQYRDFISPDEFAEEIEKADIVVSHGASGSIMKALNAGKKVIVVTRLEKYGEHINDHQIQNNEAFSSNGYVLMADLELENLGECFQKIYDGTDGLVPWENKDPMAIVKMIDKFIQENW